MLPDGCYNGLDPRSGNPVERVKALVERCAPSSEPIFEGARTVTLSAGKSAVVTFGLADPARCFTVLAATDGAAPDFSLKVRGPEAIVLGHDALEAPIAVVGPLCSRGGGQHHVELSIEEGSASAAVQVALAR
jgi:hypothetical protein